MIETLLVVGIASIVAAVVLLLIAVSMQKRILGRIQAAQQAWERAQESHRLQWQMQQEWQFLELEKKLTTQIQQLQDLWQEWEAKDAERSETLKRQYELTTTQAHIEYELARLLRVEETPLTLDHRHNIATRWQSSRLQGADLSHRNLSSRYLGYADLRDAQLISANLFMADLFRAWLAGANLTDADLSAANLTEADLRGAILSRVNFQVADLDNAVLIGADLREARNLTLEQIHSAIYDDTTRFDETLASRLRPLSTVKCWHHPHPQDNASIESREQPRRTVNES